MRWVMLLHTYMVHYDVYVPWGSVDNPCIDKQVKAAQAEQRNAEGRMKQLDQVGWDSSTDNNNFLLKKTAMHYMCHYTTTATRPMENYSKLNVYLNQCSQVIAVTLTHTYIVKC